MGDQGHELMWMDPEDEKEEPGDDTALPEDELQSEKVTVLEAELESTQKELADVRRELAAKTIQLSKRNAKLEEEALQKAKAEAEHETKRKEAEAQSRPEVDVEQLQSDLEAFRSEALSLQEQLEDALRTQAAQDKAIRAASMAAEAAAATAASEESARLTYEGQAEHEIEKLMREIASLKSRLSLQLQQKDAELARLEAEVANAQSIRNQAVRDSEHRLSELLGQRLREAEKRWEERENELQQRIVDLQVSLDEETPFKGNDILEQLAAVQAEKAELQREFDSFREMAGAASRYKSSEVARLLEENANLRARASHSMARDYASFGVSMPMDPPEKSDGSNLRLYMERALARRTGSLLGHRSIVLLLAFAFVSTLMMFALMRALMSSRGPNRWLCVLEKIGITIGDGCHGLKSAHIEELIDEIIEAHPRTM